MTSSHPREHADKHRLRGEIRVGTRGCLRLQSDNSGMARAFKELTGNITKLNDPHFVAERGLWVMMVKENDRWTQNGGARHLITRPNLRSCQ